MNKSMMLQLKYIHMYKEIYLVFEYFDMMVVRRGNFTIDISYESYLKVFCEREVPFAHS